MMTYEVFPMNNTKNTYSEWNITELANSGKYSIGQTF